jgi:Tfp pilus assembly protein PilO
MRLLVSIAQIPFVLWLLIAGGLAYMDYSDWQTNTYQALLNEVQTKSAELDNLVAANARAAEFDSQRAAKLKELQDLGEEFKSSAAKIPRTASVSALLKSFADISDAIGISISSYRPQEETSDTFVQITPIEVDVSGTYLQVMSFLDAVANLERIVHSKQITLDRPQRRGSASRINSKVLFETYSISQASIDSESQGSAAAAISERTEGSEDQGVE